MEEPNFNRVFFNKSHLPKSPSPSPSSTRLYVEAGVLITVPLPFLIVTLP